MGWLQGSDTVTYRAAALVDGGATMIRKATPIIALAAIAVVVTACGPGQGPKTSAGSLFGAALGGLAGSAIGKGKGKLVAVAGGTFLGSVIGRNIGRSLDRADRIYASRAVGHSLEHKPSGDATVWLNPDSGNTGEVMPTRTYQTPTGRYCREYQHTVTVGGNSETAYGTACRQPDGSWKMQSG